MTEGGTVIPRYDGLLTDEILGRAISELETIAEDFAAPNGSQNDSWLVACEARLDNALEDLGEVRARFQKAQT